MKLHYSSSPETLEQKPFDNLPEVFKKELEKVFGQNYTKETLQTEQAEDHEDLLELFETDIPQELVKQTIERLVLENKNLFEAIQKFITIIEKRKSTWEIDSEEPYIDEAKETIQTLSNAKFQTELFLGRGNAGHVFIAPNAHGYCIKYLHSPARQATSIEEEFLLLSEVNRTAKKFKSLKVPQAHCLAKNMNGTKNFFTMEQVQGLTLEQVVEFPSKRESSLGKEVTASLLSILEDKALRAQLLADIETLHQSGVIHGDIHPRNIMIDNQGAIWLIDFGNAIVPVNISVNATYDSVEGIKDLDIKTFFNSMDKTAKLLKEQVLTN
jgi:tRNA A-37 threonylcarbamoyl transferase component Bud32